jgi:hypothetical protein
MPGTPTGLVSMGPRHVCKLFLRALDRRPSRQKHATHDQKTYLNASISPPYLSATFLRRALS